MKADPAALLARSVSVSTQLVEKARLKILALDEQPDPATRQREMAFEAHTARAGRKVPWAGMLAEIRDARLVAIGDFATSPHPKILAGKLLRQLKNPVLALNTPSCEHQELLDRWLDGTVSTGTLRRNIGLDSRWPQNTWHHYLKLLKTARREKATVCLFEPETYRGLAQKDEDSLLLLEAILATYRGRPIITLLGELGLSPAGLLPPIEKLVGTPRIARLYADLAGPYFNDIAAGGTGQGVFKLGPQAFSACRQSPLSKRQTFLTWQAGVIPAPPLNLQQTFLCYARAIAKAFGGPPAPTRSLKLFGPGDPRFVPALAAESKLGPDEIDYLFDRILAGESRCLPGQNMVYLGNLDRGHVAEEAAHWLRAATGGEGYSRKGEDEFWGIAIHELVGFVGSKVIAPERPPLTVASLKSSGAARTEALAHLFGYNLGQRLHLQLSSEPKAKELIKRMFTKDLVEPGAAKELYFEAVDLVSGERS